jgi:hypothetical protein
VANPNACAASQKKKKTGEEADDWSDPTVINEEDLSEEDIELKKNIDMLVERLMETVRQNLSPPLLPPRLPPLLQLGCPLKALPSSAAGWIRGRAACIA